MAWSTENTRRLLLGAAAEEFIMHGLAGARVDRIASRAGINKERIYAYFGSKNSLFGAVVDEQIVAGLSAVNVRGSGIDALAAYASDVFDYRVAHPGLSRLAFWHALEPDAPAMSEQRAAALHSTVEALCAAAPGLTSSQAWELLFTVHALCDAHVALPATGRAPLAAPAGAPAWREARKATVVVAVVAVTEALLSGTAASEQDLRSQ